MSFWGLPLTDWLMVVISALLLLLALFAWRINARIAWLTGAMESHSAVMIRIEAKRGINNQPVKTIWWDPTQADFPFSGVHGKTDDLTKIYLGIPPKYRTYSKSRWPRLSRWFSGIPG
jgi:hypothetical protein